MIKVDYYKICFHVHVQSAPHIITTVGLCHSTYILKNAKKIIIQCIQIIAYNAINPKREWVII